MKSYKVQMENYSALSDDKIDVIPFFRNYINFMTVFFPITSFLLVPAIQGTTIITVLAAILTMILISFPGGANKGLFIKELAVFFLVFMAFSIVSQYLNLIYDVKLNRSMLLVVKGGFMDYFYRTSHFTQTLYLVIAFIIYLLVKYYADETIVKYIYWGLRLLCFYGLYEIVFYFVTGTKGDFLVNRKFGDGEASLTQTAAIGGLDRLIRMKSATGEPSMFTFTVFPFWALTYGLKRRFDFVLLFVSLALTFSTTAYASMVLFHFSWFLYKKKYKQIVYILLLLLLVLGISQMDAFREKIDSVYNFVFGNKLGGQSVSSRDRGGYLEYHLEYWTQELNPWSKTFGIGFGYLRSTDFFTTILVNNGWLGLAVFTGFFFHRARLRLANKDLSFCYLFGLIILFFIMMGTVPEFAYPSLWIYLALGYILPKMPKMNINETNN